MSDEKPATVAVESLKYHTGYGAEHQIGDVYELDMAAADSAVVQGLVKLIDQGPRPEQLPAEDEPTRKAKK